MYKKIIIHVGHGKTGSSTIQKSMRQRYDSFVKQGIKPLMPKSENIHILLRQAFCDSDETALKKIALLTESDSCDTLLVSSENIVTYDIESLENMKSFFDKYCQDIEVIIYLRHPYTHSVSLCQTLVKNGEILLNTYLQNPFVFRAKEQLEKLNSVFGSGLVRMHLFEKSALKNENVLDDLLINIGVADEELKAFEVTSFNESLSIDATLLADYIYTNFEFPIKSARFKQYLTKVPGVKFYLPLDTLSIIRSKASRHLEYLDAQYNFIFPEANLDVFSEVPYPVLSEEFIGNSCREIEQLFDIQLEKRK